MPHRRPARKGSFGGRFDEMVKVFEHQPSKKSDRNEKPAATDKESSVHDRLFERAWQKASED